MDYPLGLNEKAIANSTYSQCISFSCLTSKYETVMGGKYPRTHVDNKRKRVRSYIVLLVSSLTRAKYYIKQSLINIFNPGFLEDCSKPGTVPHTKNIYSSD